MSPLVDPRPEPFAPIERHRRWWAVYEPSSGVQFVMAGFDRRDEAVAFAERNRTRLSVIENPAWCPVPIRPANPLPVGA